jgi:tripartite-type tricarboxylate transporter receptor subunit TctC
VRFARVLCLLLSAAVAAAVAGSVHAQLKAKYAIRILVPLPAGSTSDAAARLIVDCIRDGFGQPVVIDNRPGGTGRIAAEALKSAPADGTTLLFAPLAVPVVGPLVFRRLNYDPAKDFAPIAQVSRYELAFAVAAHHPARSVPEFAAWAKANPARASFGTPGAGSLPHFLGIVVGRAAGIELVHISYKGPAPLEAELMSGEIAAGISAVSDFLGLHRAGKLRILATSGAKRSPLLPAVLTLREQGYPIEDLVGWHAVYAPAGTPQPVIEQLSSAIVAALQAPDLREKFIALGLEPTGTTPQALAEIMAADTARWRPIIQAAGFTAD